MILILEGRRATGKTTLTSALEEHGWKRVKKQRGWWPFGQMVWFLLRHCLSPWKKVVWDRFHITEMVMRVAEAGEVDTPFASRKMTEMAIIHNLLRKVGGKVVILDCMEAIRQRRVIESRKPEEKNFELVDRLFKSFKVTHADLCLDTTFTSCETMIKQIEEVCNG